MVDAVSSEHGVVDVVVVVSCQWLNLTKRYIGEAEPRRCLDGAGPAFGRASANLAPPAPPFSIRHNKLLKKSLPPSPLLPAKKIPVTIGRLRPLCAHL